MARQILKQQYKADLEKVSLKEESKKNESARDLLKSNKDLGVKRLGPILTQKMFLRDIQGCNRYSKIQKQTMMKLMSQIDK
jgi:hypothetical protein